MLGIRVVPEAFIEEVIRNDKVVAILRRLVSI